MRHMSRKTILILGLMVILVILAYVVLQFVIFPSKGPSGAVHNINTGLDYKTIQGAIDAPETLNGHTILVDAGTYYEYVVVNKSISLIGENRDTTIINGKRNKMGFNVTVNNVTIKEFTVKNCTVGIYLKHSNNSLLAENNVLFNTNAVLIYDSRNCTIQQNIVGNNTDRGILISTSQNFTASNNRVYGTRKSEEGYGLNANLSMNGLIRQNYVYENEFDGIGLLDSNNNVVTENIVKDNRLNGIYVSNSGNNLAYHNIITSKIDYSILAVDFNLTNRWNDSVEGNYWSNYDGVDLNHDGIGDTAYAISGGNQDNYPLMGPFYSFNTSMGYYVNVVSNSTIENFAFFQSNNTIRFYVSNSSATQSFGFCRVSIPKALMSPPYTVVIDNALVGVLDFNGTIYDNGTYRWIYFAYQHSTLKVDIKRQT
jgi:parallel beta-helix repeat protein